MPASFSLPSNALQVFNSLVFSSSGNVAVRPHGIMTACKEEQTWSTSLPETVIIYKFTIFIGCARDWMGIVSDCTMGQF